MSDDRKKCGCSTTAEEHDMNCAVRVRALELHLANCGWHTDIAECLQLELHMAKAEWHVNG